MTILAIDPGSHKTGLAVLGPGGAVLHRAIEPTQTVVTVARMLIERFAAERIVVGKGTNASALCEDLWVLQRPIQLVDERETTLQARRLYFEEHPPAGWRRLIPIGMQLPPCPIDDYAAVLIGRRYLAEGPDGQPS